MIPLQQFDFSVLEDPEFKEDAVREEIVAPLIRALEYQLTGPNRVVRGRRLEHPYLALGVTTTKIAIVPDYLLFTDDRPTWVLDAKSPSESIDDPKHHGQAYSYAVHRDVRVDWYALCNGREFGLYNVADMSPKPRLRFKVSDLTTSWGEIFTTLFPGGKIADRGKLDKDFGLLLRRVGIANEVVLHFVGVPFKHFSLGVVEPELYRFSRGMNVEGQRYLASFDFDEETLASLLSLFPEADRERLGQHLRQGSGVRVTGDLGEAHLACQLGDQEENDQEHFLPLRVRSVTGGSEMTPTKSGAAQPEPKEPAPEWAGDGARVVRLGAYYRSNEPGGIAIVHECDYEFLARLEAAVQAYDRHASEIGSADKDVEAYLRQLEALRAEKLTRALTQEELALALMNVFWLDSRGHLRADDFNGMQYIYQSRA